MRGRDRRRLPQRRAGRRASSTLAREMGGDELALEAAGGIEEPGVLGTDAERVRAAIERAMSDDGVLVLMDLGSALMSAEFAIELLDDTAGPVRAERGAAGRGRGGGRGGGERWRVARGGRGRGARGAGDEDLAARGRGRRAGRRGSSRAIRAAHRPCSRSATRSVCTRGRRRGSSRPSAASTPTCGGQGSGGAAGQRHAA